MKKTNREFGRSDLRRNQNFRLRKNGAQSETLFYQARLEIYENSEPKFFIKSIILIIIL